jgi:signal transduction histidine kinase
LIMKLFNKTLRTYLIYSFAITLVTIPLFYFVVRSVLFHSVDKSLRTQLQDIRSNLNEIHSQNELTAWSKLDKDISLSPADNSMKDDIYTIYRFSERHHEQEPYREIAGTINVDGKFYKLVISSSLIENEDLLGSILLVQTVLLISLIGGMLWINQRTSKKLWQPFYVALKNMQQFELHRQTDLLFSQSTTDEFNELNKAIKNLFSRNYEIFQQQKEFTENASHEMQTPLAIFQSKLELLMQTSPLTEDQAHLINNLDDTNRRLIKLNKSLLLLTKIENSQYEPVEGVNVISLCEKLVRQFRPYADRRGITIRENYPGPLTANANTTLLEILIGNLLSNAIRYNIQDGEIAVRIEKNILTIQNTGVGSPLPPEKIFNRFHKQGSLPGNEDSTGLGLAIVKNICTLYQYTVSYSFQDGWHSFQVIFTE